ncbi:hypothetical protein QP179_09905 [Sphingomonas aurantiaca]|uniref:hypothetical protein n=1 Tax=Sphingomonas aurantiaca TaxID=185949 RepID=UPI002FE30D19
MIDPIVIRAILYDTLCQDGDVWLGNVEEGYEEEDLADLVIDGRVDLTAMAKAVTDHLNETMTKGIHD